MCFTKDYKSRVKRAKEDIIVWKTGNAQPEAFISDVKYFIYHQGKEYRKNIFQILKAFFSSDLYGEVFHCYKYDKFSVNGYKFIIPKGTLYWQNDDGEIATTAIIYTGHHVSSPYIDYPVTSTSGDRFFPPFSEDWEGEEEV